MFFNTGFFDGPAAYGPFGPQAPPSPFSGGGGLLQLLMQLQSLLHGGVQEEPRVAPRQTSLAPSPYGNSPFAPSFTPFPQFGHQYGPQLGPPPQQRSPINAFRPAYGGGARRVGTWDVADSLFDRRRIQQKPAEEREAPPIPTDLDFKKLDKAQREQISGLNDRDRAVLHLWGIQITSQGFQDGGVVLNVQQTPDKFKPAELALAKELEARDRAADGGVTGRALDQEFFKIFEKVTGRDISDRYQNAPKRFATGPVNLDNRKNGVDGLLPYEAGVLRLWGHAPLMGGNVDGRILDYTLNSPNALDKDLKRSDVEALKQADMADGKADGDSLERAFGQVLDKIYLGGSDVTAQRTMSDAFSVAAERRRALGPSQPLPARSDAPPVDHTRLVSDRLVSSGSSSCPFLNGRA